MLDDWTSSKGKSKYSKGRLRGAIIEEVVFGGAAIIQPTVLVAEAYGH